MYQFDCNLTEKDYAEFNEYHLNNDSATRKSLLVIKLLLFAVVIIAFIVNLINYGINMMSLLLPCILLVAAFLWIYKFDERVIKKTVKNALKNQKKNGKLAYSPSSTVTFTDDMIIDKSETVEQRVKYSEVIKIANTHNALYIYITPLNAQILPKRLFKNDNEVNEFLSFLTDKCENIKG